MLALGSWVMALHMALRPSCPSTRMPTPTCTEVYDETPSPNHTPNNERRPEMMAYTPRVPSLLTETTYWESPSYWEAPSEDRVGVCSELGSLGGGDVVWEAHHTYGEPNHIAWQPGDDEAAAGVPMLYWDSPSEDYQSSSTVTRKMALGSKMSKKLQHEAGDEEPDKGPEGGGGPSLAAKRKVFFASQRLLKNVRKTKLAQQEEPEPPKETPGWSPKETPGWSYHDATSLTPGVDLSLAAKRKVFFASQHLLKNANKELAPQHEKLESPKEVDNDATSSAEASSSLLPPIDFTLQPSSKAFFASQRLLDIMDPRRGVLDFTLQPSSGEAFFTSQRLLDIMDPRRGLHGEPNHVAEQPGDDYVS